MQPNWFCCQFPDDHEIEDAETIAAQNWAPIIQLNKD